MDSFFFRVIFFSETFRFLENLVNLFIRELFTCVHQTARSFIFEDPHCQWIMALGCIKKTAGFNFQNLFKLGDGFVGGQSALLPEKPGKIGYRNIYLAGDIAERKPLFLNGFIQQPDKPVGGGCWFLHRHHRQI